MNGWHPLEITSDALRVQLMPRGASLIGLRGLGSPRNMVLALADPREHYRLLRYAGAIVGPVANRVRGGKVVIAGRTYQMPLNEAGRTALHSGDDGLHARDWTVTAQAPDRVTFACALRDGEAGLPGNRALTADYAVSGDILTLALCATTDRTTVMNLAAHPYFNLDGTRDLSGHQLRVRAAHYLPTNAQLLPTGEVAATAGSAFDFADLTGVPMTAKLDLNFCLSEARRQRPRPAVTLIGGDGTTLDIATTAPGVQVYAGANLPVLDAPTADGPLIAPFAGIALEPQDWPDAPHHGHFPPILLSPGQTYRSVTRYRLATA